MKKYLLPLLPALLTSVGYARMTQRNNAARVTLRDVRVCLFINYAHGMSKGEYFYPIYRIKKQMEEFDITATDKAGNPSIWSVPLTLQEMKPDTTNAPRMLPIAKTNYVSVKENYTVNDKTYTVYKHINYNCYDAFCGQRHGHLPHETGITYFSEDNGILIHIDQQRISYELLAATRNKAVPHDLIIAILTQLKTAPAIIEAYKEKTSR